MSVADHAARFRAQLAFDLSAPPPRSPPPAAADLETPTRDALVAAARENEVVRAFIADRVPTWSEARVERDPPCVLVYEHGEVVGSVAAVPGMIRHAEKRRGMGRMLGIRALRPDDEVLPYNIGLRRSPTHPRRYRYEQRMALKGLLQRGDRRAVTEAMRRTRRDFVAWVDREQGLATRVADATGLSPKSFWRTVRGRERQDSPCLP
jgi:hypothetical protein